MPFALEEVIYGGIVPALVTAVAAAGLLYCNRLHLSSGLRDQRTVSRAAVPVATWGGFFVGYRLLSLAPWLPAAHWQWMPYALLAAAIVGPIASAEHVPWGRRAILTLIVALAAGWVLVPDWEDLAPSRTVHLTVFVVYVVVSSMLMQPLVKRQQGPILPVVLWATLTAAAVVVALSGSLRLAQMAIAVAGALFGLVFVASFRRSENLLQGIAVFFSVATIGGLLIGRVNSYSSVPLASYLMIPAAPLSVWCGVYVGQTSRPSGIKQIVTLMFAPLLILAVAVGIAAMAELGGAEAY